jgi:response regulator RpfG family c-di-GMP phosphodiesterase
MTSTILIVDDDATGRQTLEAILDGQGYRLEMAENGLQAIEKARQVLPDVILLDVMMPGMDGFEACQRIRSDPLLAEIPIIMLTALDDRKSLLDGLESGADDYITKPYDRHELRARLIGITRLNRYRKLLDERINLEQAHLQLLAAYDATIEGWSRAMDLRDKETEGHTQLEYLRSSLDIPYCHHEKWDGTGYPRRLKGEEIPLAARVFAVVDVWDAVTSDRPYRRAWDREKALKYIKDEAGKQFDPRIVELFNRLLG